MSAGILSDLISLNHRSRILTIFNLSFSLWSWLKFWTRSSLIIIIIYVLKGRFFFSACLNMWKIKVEHIYCLSPSVKWLLILNFLVKICVGVWIWNNLMFINSFMFRFVPHFNQVSYSRILIGLTLIVSLNSVIQKRLTFQILQSLEVVNCSLLLNAVRKRIKHIMGDIKKWVYFAGMIPWKI